MFRWRKLARCSRPQDVPGRPWLKEFAQAPATLVFDDFVRVYFSCRPPPDENGQYVSYSAYVDLDRADLFTVVRVAEQPILSWAASASSTSSAPTRCRSSATATRCVAYYGGWTRCESVPFNVAIGCARSATSGKTFTKLGNGPVLRTRPDEPFVLSGPKIRRFNDLWYLLYIAGRKWKMVDGRRRTGLQDPHGHVVETASTGRGLNEDLIESRIEEDEAQASPDVFYASGNYHMFFCYQHSSDYPRQGERLPHRLRLQHRPDGLGAGRRAGPASTCRTKAGTPR